MSTGFFNSAESVVTYAATVAELVLLVRLTWLGLIREFKVFWILLAYDVLLTAALTGCDYQSYAYARVWAVTTPAWTLLLAAASYELLRGLAKPIPRDPINRKVALYGFLIGLTFSIAVSMLLHPQGIFRHVVLLAFMTKQCILSGCILAILAQGAYFGLGGLPLIANWRKHRRVLLVYLTAQVIGSFVANSGHQQLAAWIGVSRDVALLACYCAWIAGFERAWRHLRFPPFASPPNDETLAELFAYRARARGRSKNPVPAVVQLSKLKTVSNRRQ